MISNNMGHAYRYRCSSCGFQASFNQGYGFLVHPQPVREYLSRRSRLFHYKVHRLLGRLVEDHEGLFLKAGFQVYRCPKCKSLHDKVEVVVYKDQEIVHKSDFRCSMCRSRMKLTNIHRLKAALCPGCGKKTFRLDHESHLLWD